MTASLLRFAPYKPCFQFAVFFGGQKGLIYSKKDVDLPLRYSTEMANDGTTGVTVEIQPSQRGQGRSDKKSKTKGDRKWGAIHLRQGEHAHAKWQAHRRPLKRLTMAVTTRIFAFSSFFYSPLVQHSKRIFPIFLKLELNVRMDVIITIMTWGTHCLRTTDFYILRN